MVLIFRTIFPDILRLFRIRIKFKNERKIRFIIRKEKMKVKIKLNRINSSSLIWS